MAELEYWVAVASALAWLVHWALAIFVVADDIKWDAPVHLYFNVWKSPNGTDEGCGDVVCVTEPVYWKLKDDPSNAKLLVSLFSFVSGTNHLITFIAFILNNTFLKQMFWGANKNGPNLLRSFDWGVSAPLMIVVNLFLYRIPADMLALFGYALFTAVIVFVGYLFDTLLAIGLDVGYEKVRTYVGVKSFGVVCLLYLVSWEPLFLIFPYSIGKSDSSLFNGLYYDYGLPYINANPREPPPEVYVFIFWLFASFAIFPIVQLLKINAYQKIQKQDRVKLYIKYEFYFIFLSALSKLPLLLLFYGGIKSRQNTRLSEDDIESTKKKEFDFTYLAVGLILAFSLGIIETIIYKYKIKPGTGNTETSMREKLIRASTML